MPLLSLLRSPELCPCLLCYFSWTSNQYKYLSHTINLHFLCKQAHLGQKATLWHNCLHLMLPAMKRAHIKAMKVWAKAKYWAYIKLINKWQKRKNKPCRGKSNSTGQGGDPSWCRGRGVTLQPLLDETQFVLQAQHFIALANGNQQSKTHPSTLVLSIASFHFSPLASPSCFKLFSNCDTMNRQAISFWRSCSSFKLSVLWALSTQRTGIRSTSCMLLSPVSFTITFPW